MATPYWVNRPIKLSYILYVSFSSLTDAPDNTFRIRVLQGQYPGAVHAVVIFLGNDLSKEKAILV
jgi:hypothetical protein